MNLPSVSGKNPSQYSVISKSHSVLQIQIAVDRDWRWPVSVEIRLIFILFFFSLVEKLVYTKSSQLHSRHRALLKLLFVGACRGLYMLGWIEIADQWPIQMGSVSLLYFLSSHLHNKSGVRLRHWKPMLVWLSIKSLGDNFASRLAQILN